MTESQSKSKELQTYQNGETTRSKTNPREQEGGISNEYVLNVAFWTFLGFLLLEAVFALIANSQSMLEDAEAMSVDALTYLFNLCAERVKHRPYTAKELEMPEAVREYKREMTRLYLEVVPPLISVTTLIAVTVYAVEDAVESLCQPKDVPAEDVDVSIMMWFSGANLLLDLVNVTCFARAGQAFGLATLKREAAPTRFSMRGSSNTLAMQIETQQLLSVEACESGEADVFPGPNLLVNLNMCSAWTVSTSTGHFVPRKALCEIMIS